ncbi:MAG: DUF2255 family protein [Nonomuraea sp.]|nr:DUF2255 family protein [Nonomuraea sp.]
MTDWTDEELAAVGQAEELDLRSARADGSLRDPVTMWVVRDGSDLYVRPIKGREGWYRGTRTRHEGHVSSGGIGKDVTFEDAAGDSGLNAALDDAYRAKYGRYPENIVATVVSDLARSATLRLTPR